MSKAVKQIIQLLIISISLIIITLLCFYNINFILEKNNDRKIEIILTEAEKEKELIKFKYSYNKAEEDNKHLKTKEILNLMQSFENSNRAMNYENDYQLKKIEFKGTVFESCSQYYEKSIDFIDCVKNILRNDLYK